MLNQTSLNLPMPGTGIAQALLAVAVGGAAPTYTLHPVTPGTLPEPVALGLLDAGATVVAELRWFDGSGAQVGLPVATTFTLPSGPDSPLGLTITTRPGPTPEPLPPPTSD